MTKSTLKDTQIAACLFLVGGFAVAFLVGIDFMFHLTTAFNKIAMPITSVVLFTGALLLLTKEKIAPQVMAAVYIYISVYLQIDVCDVFLGAKDPRHALMTLSLFFPILYLCSHFCVPKAATLASWLNYIGFMGTSYFILLTAPMDRYDGMFKKGLMVTAFAHPTYLIALHFILKLKKELQEGKLREESLATQLCTDPLTQISNRIALNKLIDLDEQSLKQGNSEAVTVLMIDIDHFKAINDTYGHGVGDSVLKEVAKALSAQVRKEDVIGRWGGEEFQAILKTTDPAIVNAISKRLLESTKNIRPSPLAPPVTLSIGVSHRRDHESLPKLINEADTHLYTAKKSGRNRIVSDFNPAMTC